jgi:hypothetical protein
VSSSSSAPLPFALHRRTEEQRRNAATDLLHAGADARRRPTPSSTTPPSLLSATLLGDWIFLCTLAAVPSRRPSFGKLFFHLCSSSFVYFCSLALAILLA